MYETLDNLKDFEQRAGHRLYNALIPNDPTPEQLDERIRLARDYRHAAKDLRRACGAAGEGR